MSDLGEIDMRGVFIAMLIADVLNIKSKKLLNRVEEYI